MAGEVDAGRVGDGGRGDLFGEKVWTDDLAHFGWGPLPFVMWALVTMDVILDVQRVV